MDNLTPEARRRTMQRVKAKDTKPELIVRRLVHSLGYRYRLHSKDLPGKPDLVFPGRKAAVFVHGCWWHMHRCKAGQKSAKSNAPYWKAKRERNRDRDRKVRRKLQTLGWRVMVVWECQLRDLDRLSHKLQEHLS